MTKKICCIDLDGVLADFWKEMTNRHPELLDMGGEEERKEYVDHLLATKSGDVFGVLDPIEGAQEAFWLLCDHYNVYILSTPSIHAPKSYTDKYLWCTENLGEKAHKKLILSHNKGLIKADYLIDDRIANGVAEFEGIHIHYGQLGVENWDKVIVFLKDKDKW